MKIKNFDAYYDEPEEMSEEFVGEEPDFDNSHPSQAEMEAMMEELAELYPDKFGIEAVYSKLMYGVN